MDMKNRLPGSFITIHDNAVALLRYTFHGSNFCSCKIEFADQLCIVGTNIIDRGYMLFRDNQGMGGRLRIKIAERQYIIIFKNYISRNFPVDDFAENTIARHLGTSYVVNKLYVILSSIVRQTREPAFRHRHNPGLHPVALHARFCLSIYHATKQAH